MLLRPVVMVQMNNRECHSGFKSPAVTCVGDMLDIITDPTLLGPSQNSPHQGATTFWHLKLCLSDY